MNDTNAKTPSKTKTIVTVVLVAVICAGAALALSSDLRKAVGLEEERPQARMLINPGYTNERGERVE
ncbi:MAG: hypothetical protein AAF724_14940 [Pseudomonadota bacterium]